MAISGSLNFLTIGETGSANIGVDFVGLNTVIAEPFTASTNMLGMPDTPGATAYYNSEVDSFAPFDEVPTHLNSILLHRNGPYQHPSWKQCRGAEHPIARSMRLNNTMSIDAAFADPIRRETAKRNERGLLENITLQDQETYYENVNKMLISLDPFFWPYLYRQPSLARYYEPSVLKAHKPFIYTVNSTVGSFKVRSTLMNQMVFFENKNLNESLNIAGPDRTTASIAGAIKTPKQQYYDLLTAAKANGASNFVYAQTIFPKSINAFRPYKLEKPVYEEGTGTDSNGYDRQENRSFWRNSQPEGLRDYNVAAAATDGATRTRTELSSYNSQDMQQLQKSLTERANQNYEGSYTLFTTASTDNEHDLGSWNFTYRFIENGVIAYGGIMTVTKSVDPAGVDIGMPTQPPGGAFNTLEAYSPHLISLMSMWPLDPRSDIYNSPGYLTSTIGGRGLQIGVTPNRAIEYVGTTYIEALNPVYTASLSASVDGGSHPYRDSFFVGGAGTTHTVGDGTYAVTASATASYGQILSNLQVTTAGELVYSTKPTMFYHITGSVTGSKREGSIHTNPLPLIGDLKGYTHQTASLQYNRHTFPYNTPFYATHKVRGRNPFYDTYADFSEDMKYLGRDYSIVPEYNVAKNIEYYYETFFKSTLDKDLHIEKDIGPQEVDPVNPNNSFYSLATVTKPRIIKRNLKIYQSQPLYSLHKLNFLTLDGAFVTSSGATQDFSDAVPNTAAFSYDPLEKTTDSSTLESVIGYNSPKTALHYAQDSTAVIFNEALSHTDNTGEFWNLLLNPMKDSEHAIPTRIKFTVHALKKLRPEKNFYPVLKTLDVGNKFKNFIYENINTAVMPASDGNILFRAGNVHGGTDENAQLDQSPGQLQAFLEPFFAPGILYNSIKSGIAVDYPVYTKLPAYLAPWTFFSGSVEHYARVVPAGITIEKDWSKYGKPHTSNRLSNFVTGVINYGSFYMLGASRCLPSILTKIPDYRMPFEALYKTSIVADKFNVLTGKALHLTTDFLDLDINTPDSYATTASAESHKGAVYEHPGAAHTYTGPRGQLLQTSPDNTNRALYESSINNFLCETMNFFLKDQGLEGVKLPVLVSKAKSDSDFSLSADKLYSMAITLKMGKDQVMCEGPRDAGQGAAQRGTGLSPVPPYHSYTHPRHRMRGYIYGPPIEIIRMSGSSTTSVTERTDSDGNIKLLEPLIESDAAAANQIGQGKYGAYFGANLQDPAYQAFTPPYFYGQSSLILAAQDIDAPIDTWTSMFQQTEKDSYYLENYVTGTGLEELCLTIPGTGSASGFYSTRMKIDSSVDIYKKATVKVRTPLDDGQIGSSLKNVWYITPKWISPVLDFSSSYASVTTLAKQGIMQEYELSASYVNNTYHDTTTGRGLWGGYGTDPYDPSAMKIVNDLSNITTELGGTLVSSKKNIEKGIILEIKDPSNNFQYSSSIASYNTTDATFEGAVSSHYTQKLTTQNQNNTGSLGLELGFLKNTTDVKKINIGEIANEKKISEALVIVPYFEKPIQLPAGPLFPAGELFRTREIIPGKYFLPINNMLFENLLSMALAVREKSLTELLPKKGLGAASGFVPTSKLIGFEHASAYLTAAGTDAYKMIETILGDEQNGIPGYELPPEFDFVNYDWAGISKMNPSIPGPFQMIIVPVDHTLQKQELIDIYQGIMPESSLSFTKQTESKVFDLSPNASKHSWMPKTKGYSGPDHPGGVSLAGMNPANFLDCSYLYQKDLHAHVENKFLNSQWIKTSRDFYKNLKFMTFKIKQRAIKDYDNYKHRQIAKVVENKLVSELTENQKLEDFDFGFSTRRQVSDVFGYNWPYDDFSLVETVKIDIEIEVEE